MFVFDTLITGLITIILSYITLYFTFRHQLDEIESSNKDDNKYNIIKRIRFINLFFPILIIIILFLYFLPDIRSIHTQIDFTFLTNIFPFKKVLFDNSNFKFSYITGIIFSIIIIILFIVFNFGLYLKKAKNKIIVSFLIIFTAILISYALIWINFYISTFLNYCINYYFERVSIILNVLSYGIIYLVLCFISYFIYMKHYHINL